MAAKKVGQVKTNATKAAPESDTPPVKTGVAQHGRAEPVRAVSVRIQPKPEPKEQPDLVMVRALERGQYGLDVDIIVRNPGEVFPMATSAMRKFPYEKGETPIEDATIIETEKGQFELPGWVELIQDDEEVTAEDLEKHGHSKKWHGQTAADGTRNMEVM